MHRDKSAKMAIWQKIATLPFWQRYFRNSVVIWGTLSVLLLLYNMQSKKILGIRLWTEELKEYNFTVITRGQAWHWPG